MVQLVVCPPTVPGDGNCFFNSLSVVTAGNLSLVNKLRVRTCIEMVANKEMYTRMHQRTGLPLVSPDYSVAMRECAVDGTYSSAWTIAAASTVLKTRVMSVYPPVNGLVDKTTAILHRVFHPVDEDTTRRPIFVMWTNVCPPSPSRTWFPNHFVPLLVNRVPSTVVVSDESSKNSTAGSTTPGFPRASTPKKVCISWHTRNNRQSSPVSPNSDQPSPVSPNSDQPSPVSPVSPNSDQPSPVSPVSPYFDLPSPVSPNSDQPSPVSPVSPTSSKPAEAHELLLNGGIPLDPGAFSEPEHVLRLMTHGKPCSETIPRGVKENVMFLLDNAKNVERRTKGKWSVFVDDCGVWSKPSSKTHHYVMEGDGRLNYVDKKNGLLFVKFNCVRVSRTYPELPAPHGNSKKTSGDYIRTSASVKRKLDEFINDHDNAPRKIYEQMALDSSETVPRDLKQVQNAKYLANKRKKTATSSNHRVNVADNIQTVLSEFHEHLLCRRSSKRKENLHPQFCIWKTIYMTF